MLRSRMFSLFLRLWEPCCVVDNAVLGTVILSATMTQIHLCLRSYNGCHRRMHVSSTKIDEPRDIHSLIYFLANSWGLNLFHTPPYAPAP